MALSCLSLALLELVEAEPGRSRSLEDLNFCIVFRLRNLRGNGAGLDVAYVNTV